METLEQIQTQIAESDKNHDNGLVDFRNNLLQIIGTVIEGNTDAIADDVTNSSFYYDDLGVYDYTEVHEALVEKLDELKTEIADAVFKFLTEKAE